MSEVNLKPLRDSDKALINATQLEEIFHAKPKSKKVRDIRKMKGFPPHIKLGKAYYWRKKDVLKWIDKCYISNSRLALQVKLASS